MPVIVTKRVGTGYDEEIHFFGLLYDPIIGAEAPNGAVAEGIEEEVRLYQDVNCT